MTDVTFGLGTPDTIMESDEVGHSCVAHTRSRVFEYSSSRTASIVCLLLILAIRVSAQCPPLLRIPDPPGWAIDRGGDKNIFRYQLSEDGKWFGFNSEGGIWLMNVHTGESKELLPCIEVSADAFAFAPDSSLLAFGTGNGVSMFSKFQAVL